MNLSRNRGNHHRIKCQALESCDKNLNERIIQENSVRIPKIFQSKGKFTPIIFINSAHVKISQKHSQTYQSHIVNFWIFCKKIQDKQGVQIASIKVYIAINLRKTQERPKTHGYRAQTHTPNGSGSI